MTVNRVARAFKHSRLKTDGGRHTVDRAFEAHIVIPGADAIAQDLVSVLVATPLTGEVQDVTEGIANPAYPRNLRVKGNAAGITGDVIVTGTNFAGEEITETFALNGSGTIEGNKAFATVEKVELPSEVNAGTDTVSIGVGNKLGIPYKLELNTVTMAFRGGAKEGTLPTVTVSAANIESNTMTLSSALNGTQVDVFLLV